MGIKKEGVHQRSKGEDFGKSIFFGLGGVLETSFGSTTLQEVGILPTLIYSYFLWIKKSPYGLFGLMIRFYSSLGVVWVEKSSFIAP